VGSDIQREIKLEIVHVLFLDIVGYSKALTDQQQEQVDRLNQAVRGSPEFQKAAAADRLIKIPTGDGMALIFYNSPEQPVNCATEISRALKDSSLPVRMGVHSGPVSAVTDLNDRVNAAGVGINVAQRVMDCGDTGHILVSKRVAEDLQQYSRWRPHLHDLGEIEVKHGERVHVFNFYTDEAGNPDPPNKLLQAKPQHRAVPARTAAKPVANGQRLSICVLPFVNMSGDPEQEYFSDGISEDIITDLSKVSALHVVSRNTAFTFKGKAVDVGQVAAQLKVTHVLEGSVRKAAGRVRISAQLIDGANDKHLWAERYDRDLNDIFAIQDEISRAIVDALKVQLLPEEKKAIEQRGTENVDAYNLFLMARQTFATAFEGDARCNEAVIRLCRRAVEIDPNYAEAWAFIAMAEMRLRSTLGEGRGGDGGLAAAERALKLNPDLAEAHAVKARILFEEDRNDEAFREIEIALQLDPESHQVNRSAGLLEFQRHQLKEAARRWEKAAALEEADFGSSGMLITCYTALGNKEAVRRAAEITLARAEKVLAHDLNNGSAMGHGSIALAVLGQRERAKDWMGRALLIDPENLTVRYNFACALVNHLNDTETALEMLAPAFEKMGAGLVKHAKVDPDFDIIRDDPRFKEMLEAAERRVGASE